MKAILPCLTFLFTASCLVPAWADDSTLKIETRFYRAVSSNDPDSVRNLMHPELKKLVDPPVMEAWCEASQSTLGSFVTSTRTSQKKSRSLSGVTIEITADVEFSRAKATSKMTFFNGALVAFQMEADSMQDWFQGPARTDFYEEKAIRFIRAFLNQDADLARSMMHDALKKAVPGNALNEMMAQVAENSGRLTNTQLRDSKVTITETRDTLTLNFDIECENASGTGTIEFGFVGMKGHLIAFNFK